MTPEEIRLRALDEVLHELFDAIELDERTAAAERGAVAAHRSARERRDALVAVVVDLGYRPGKMGDPTDDRLRAVVGAERNRWVRKTVEERGGSIREVDESWHRKIRELIREASP